jgi:hypothetical protein
VLSCTHHTPTSNNLNDSRSAVIVRRARFGKGGMWNEGGTHGELREEHRSVLQRDLESPRPVASTRACDSATRVWVQGLRAASPASPPLRARA